MGNGLSSGTETCGGEATADGLCGPSLRGADFPPGVIGAFHGHVWFFLGLAVAVVLGSVLRLYQLPAQIISDDEWHALLILLGHGYGYILSHFGSCDYCIPLTVFYKLASQTTGLGEITMRLPMLVAGLLSLAVMPVILSRVSSLSVAGLFAWLLALSPLHIYFSRYARPYMPGLFLTFLACSCFHAWWQCGGRPYMAGHIVCAGLAIYSHLFFAPACLAPYVFAALQLLVSRESRQKGQVVGAVVSALLLAGLCLLFLGVPLMVDGGALFSKASGTRLNFHTVLEAFSLMAGTGNSVWMGIGGGLALHGLFVMWKTRRGLFGYVSTIAVLQVAGIAYARPVGMEVPIIFARYCLVLLPVILLSIAFSLAGLCGLFRQKRGRVAMGVVCVGLAVWAWRVGPLRSIYYYPNAWTNHGLFQYSYGRPFSASYDPLKPVKISGFYRALGDRKPGSLSILEVPWRFEWHFNPYPFFQKVHRQNMKVGFVGEELSPGEIPLDSALSGGTTDFANMVHVGDEAKLDDLRIDYVVFHPHLEEAWRDGWMNDFFVISVAGEWVQTQRSVLQWMERYETRYGAPVYKDEDITVFRVSRAGEKRGESPYAVDLGVKK